MLADRRPELGYCTITLKCLLWLIPPLAAVLTHPARYSTGPLPTQNSHVSANPPFSPLIPTPRTVRAAAQKISGLRRTRLPAQPGCLPVPRLARRGRPAPQSPQHGPVEPQGDTACPQHAPSRGNPHTGCWGAGSPGFARWCHPSLSLWQQPGLSGGHWENLRSLRQSYKQEDTSGGRDGQEARSSMAPARRRETGQAPRADGRRGMRQGGRNAVRIGHASITCSVCVWGRPV